MSQKPSSFSLSIFLIIVLGLVISGYIFGWTIPTAPPPGSNLPAPIETSSSTQSKRGYLAVGTTTTPAYPLEVGNQLRVWGQLISKVASGTASFVVDSPTKVANLNADLLDGYNSSDFLASTASKKYKLICAATSSLSTCVNPTVEACPVGWTELGMIGYNQANGIDNLYLYLATNSGSSICNNGCCTHKCENSNGCSLGMWIHKNGMAWKHLGNFDYGYYKTIRVSGVCRICGQ